jgi:6-phosphogluconolactonase
MTLVSANGFFVSHWSLTMLTSTNRTYFALILLTMAGTFLSTSTSVLAVDSLDVWIGTSSAKPSKGIYHCRLDVEKGTLSEPNLAAEISGPGFLAMHPQGHHLYAVGTLEGVPSVVAYKITRQGDQSTLVLDNALAIGDGGAAHVAVDRTGKTLLTAQYGGGSVAAFRLAADGALGEQTLLIKHEGGSGVVPGRQDAPHAHWVGFSPDNRFCFVPDLGLDRVMIYSHDLDRAKIDSHGSAQVPAGGGPRHMKFHPSGKWAYVLNELALSVTVFDYEPEAAVMTARQTIPTVPKAILEKEQFSSASEIRIHPNGRFVYSANRGHDTITAFEVDQDTGELSVIELENIRGATPRNFNLDPSGRWLIAAGQDSHTLACFAVDPNSGELTHNRSIVFAPSPICVLFQHE